MESSSSRTVSGSLRPRRSRAAVVYCPGEQRAVERVARRLFRCRLKRCEYAGLTGAPDDAEVEVGTYDGGLYLEMCKPLTNCYRGVYLIRPARSSPVLVIDALHIRRKDMQRKGLGLCIFQRQLEHADALGIKQIATIAGRQRDESGYYTWPRFGFNGPLPLEIRRNLPLGLDHAQTVLDVMESPKGRLWWKEQGTPLPLVFEVTGSSRSRRVFEQYLNERSQPEFQTGVEHLLPSCK